MKYVAVFALVAFAFLAQANARSVVPDSEDRGDLANSLRAKLIAAKEKINNLLKNAAQKFKDGLHKLERTAEVYINKLSTGAGNFINNKVFVAAEKLVNKVEELEDKFVGPSKTSTTPAAVEEVTEVVEEQTEAAESQ